MCRSSLANLVRTEDLLQRVLYKEGEGGEREREREKEKGKGGEVEVQWRRGVMWESGGEEEGWRNDR